MIVDISKLIELVDARRASWTRSTYNPLASVIRIHQMVRLARLLIDVRVYQVLRQVEQPTPSARPVLAQIEARICAGMAWLSRAGASS